MHYKLGPAFALSRALYVSQSDDTCTVNGREWKHVWNDRQEAPAAFMDNRAVIRRTPYAGIIVAEYNWDAFNSVCRMINNEKKLFLIRRHAFF